MVVFGRLPKRFPVGTRYVLEGVPGKEGQLQVISRIIVLPNGTRFDLTHEPLAQRPSRRRSGASRRRATH